MRTYKHNIPDQDQDDHFDEQEPCFSCGINGDLDVHGRCYECGLTDATEYTREND